MKRFSIGVTANRISSGVFSDLARFICCDVPVLKVFANHYINHIAGIVEKSGAFRAPVNQVKGLARPAVSFG